MNGRLRPQIVVFDVVETLASLDAVADRLAEYGLDRAVLDGWFTRLLRDGMALTAAGGYAGFAEVAASALHTQTRGALTDAQLARVVAGFGELAAQPDAAVAVRAAAKAGMRVFTLTNGPAATTQAFLSAPGWPRMLTGCCRSMRCGRGSPPPRCISTPFAVPVCRPSGPQ